MLVDVDVEYRLCKCFMLKEMHSAPGGHTHADSWSETMNANTFLFAYKSPECSEDKLVSH